jgi:hypothetical protein
MKPSAHQFAKKMPKTRLLRMSFSFRDEGTPRANERLSNLKRKRNLPEAKTTYDKEKSKENGYAAARGS